MTETVRNRAALSVVRFVPDDPNTLAYVTVINFGDTEETINIIEGVELPQGEKRAGLVLINSAGDAGYYINRLTLTKFLKSFISGQLFQLRT